MVLLSRADKGRPQSPFKKVYTAARQGRTAWAPVFLPWHARPDRDAAWYEAQRADVLHRTGALDELHEQYPATDAEARAPRALDKRIAPEWLHQCYQEQEPYAELPAGAPSVPGLAVYALPQPGRTYVIGADPAEGNPTSDDSALTVLDEDTGEEAASLAGKFQPSVFGAHIDLLGRWYNNAAVLVERNNHGHAVLLWLREHSALWLLPGHDGQPAWHTNGKGKALLYDRAADAFRECRTVLHGFAAFAQLASIEGSSLRAPPGEPDDLATAYALALVACQFGGVRPYSVDDWIRAWSEFYGTGPALPAGAAPGAGSVSPEPAGIRVQQHRYGETVTVGKVQVYFPEDDAIDGWWTR
jgi:hypothetical protein